MRKIFIDAGCNEADSLKDFLSGKMFPDVENPEQYEIIAIDVSPQFVTAIEKMCRLYGAFEWQFLHRAVWTRDEPVNCMFCKDNSVSSSVVTRDNKTARFYLDHEGLVDGMDFSIWIEDSFDKEDEIILKMDIEGAEFHVLPKMMEEATMLYINRLAIEFHHGWKKYGTKASRCYYTFLREMIMKYLAHFKIPVKEYK